MSIVEIHCPRCGSPAAEKGEENRYQCNHCKAEFLLVDPSKRRVTYETKRHYCPICGRPVRAEEAHKCVSCGKEDLCKNCIKLSSSKVLCYNCSRMEVSKLCECTVCGRKITDKDTDDSDFWVRFVDDENDYTPVCKKCKGEVCRKCIIEENDSKGNCIYRCKKCGSELSYEKFKFNQ